MVEPFAAQGGQEVHRPESVEDLSEIVGGAGRSGTSLLLQSGRTHERFSNRAKPPAAIVDLTGLDSVIDYSSVDLTLAVESGVRLSAIDQLLAEHDQRLAIDAPHRDRATIGGTFASGLSGPRRLRYGSLKDMVIGTEIVTSQGVVTKSGGMVVKNVSGYELSRLHYGAHGAYGIVTRINLKVLPAVESRVEAVARFEQLHNAHAAGVALLTSTLEPAAVYLLNSGTANWELRATFEGSKRFASDQAGRAIGVVEGGDRGEWSGEIVAIHGCSTPSFDAIASLRDEDLVVRMSIPASKQGEQLSRIPEERGAAILADMGSGLVYVRMAANEEALRHTLEMDFPATILTMPDELKPGVDVFGPMDENGRRILKALKDQYDPNRIFNRGRFASFL